MMDSNVHKLLSWYSMVLFAQEELPKIVDKLVSVCITVKNDVKTANVTII